MTRHIEKWMARDAHILFTVQIKPTALSVSTQIQYISFYLPLCRSSHQGTGIHLVWGDDVRLHHRAAALAGGWDDLLLQEDRGSRGGSSERERVSNTEDTQTHTRPASLQCQSFISRTCWAVQMSWFPTNRFHNLSQCALFKITSMFSFFLAELISGPDSASLTLTACVSLSFSLPLSFLQGGVFSYSIGK